jgi:hypothetical protein
VGGEVAAGGEAVGHQSGEASITALCAGEGPACGAHEAGDVGIERGHAPLGEQAGRAEVPQTQVVLNWFEELKRRVPVK